METETIKSIENIKNTSSEEILTYQQVLNLIKATNDMLDKKFEETRSILDSKFQATDLKFQATDLKFQATDKELKDLIKFSKEQDKKVKELNKLFVNQWGQLVESLVEGKMVELLNQRGIKVQQTATNLKSSRNEAEFDIIAENGKEIVVIEVKTTLRKEYTDEFLEKLDNFKNYFPKYKDNIIYGAVAYLKSPINIAKYSAKQDLFLIKATGDSAFIVNPEDFKPKCW